MRPASDWPTRRINAGEMDPSRMKRPLRLWWASIVPRNRLNKAGQFYASSTTTDDVSAITSRQVASNRARSASSSRLKSRGVSVRAKVVWPHCAAIARGVRL